MKISSNRWNIIQRIIREYHKSKSELEKENEGTPYYERLMREVDAIETSLALFNENEIKVIKSRFWTYEDKNKGYEQMWDLHYSSRQLRRICYRMVYQVGKELGEVK